MVIFTSLSVVISSQIIDQPITLRMAPCIVPEKQHCKRQWKQAKQGESS